jgi:glycolate oxidase
MTIAFPQPDKAILARREEILAGLSRLVPGEALITTEDERRAFETDALTAYRRMPLAVVLPTSTAEVSAVMRFCHDNGVKVVPRGAGTSLAGGAIPQEDACNPASPISRSPRPWPMRASSTPPTRRASSPARSRATSL